MVEYIDFCDKFCEIEKNNRLFELKFNGVQYWKYARYYVYNMIYHNLYGVNVPFWFDNKNEWKLPKYTHKYQKFTDILFHNINIGLKKDVLLFTFHRRIKNGKRFVSPVTDDISLQLERSHCIVESPYCGGYYRPTPIRGIKYFDVWEGIGEDAEQNIPIDRGHLRKQVLSIFEKEFDIKFSKEEKRVLLTNVNYYIMYHNDLIKNYKKIIKKIAPKVVVYTAAYIGDMVVLTEALKEMKIPSIELIHGYIAETTIPYNYSDIGLNDTLPDYIFVYSQIQKDIIKWGIPKEHIRVVGWPWLEKKKAEMASYISPKKNKKVITFISSTSFLIKKYLESLTKKLNQEQYEIVFKLHPTEYGNWKETYQDLPQSVHIIDNNDKDIHYYLANSDIVIGINSTALYEAAIYPVGIIVLQEEGYKNMDTLLKAGRALLAHDEDELFTSIKNDSSLKNKIDINLFEENALANINNEIEKIIREREKEC